MDNRPDMLKDSPPKKIRQFSKNQFLKAQLELISAAYFIQGLELDTYIDCLEYAEENGPKYSPNKFEKRQGNIAELKALAVMVNKCKAQAEKFFLENKKWLEDELQKKTLEQLKNTASGSGTRAPLVAPFETI